MRWQTLHDTLGWRSVGKGEGLARRGIVRRAGDVGVWMLVILVYATVGLPVLAWRAIAALGRGRASGAKQKPRPRVDAPPPNR